MPLMGWVGMDRSRRGRSFFHWGFNMDYGICIGTANGLERFNNSIGNMGGVNLAFNIPQRLQKMLIEELLEHRSSTNNPRWQQLALSHYSPKPHSLP